MRLLTHNFLKSNVKGTENGYPLNIEVTTIRCEDSPVDKEFVLNMLPKINYPALRTAVQQMSPYCDPPLPELPEELHAVSSSSKDKEEEGNNQKYNNLDESVIANLHRVLFDVYLVEGWLVCPDTGRKFPVKECIPNMILHEDEI
ncbi:hypothetical protein ACHAXR_011889 [Thalassiosira sp. AJA248-18]